MLAAASQLVNAVGYGVPCFGGAQPPLWEPAMGDGRSRRSVAQQRHDFAAVFERLDIAQQRNRALERGAF